MKERKRVVIVTDGSEETSKMAKEISAALKSNEVTVKTAPDFLGNDLLPADAFFLGCEKPNPGSFTYLEEFLKHVNLAGRPCGVFSPNPEKTVKYLAGLVKDSEAVLHPESIFAGSGADLKKWANSVVSGSF